MPEPRELLVETVGAAIELMATASVAQHWDSPSVLPEMTVGAVAVHLVNATCQTVNAYLDAEPPPGDRALAAHRLIAGVPADLSADVHERVRSGSVDQAAMGAKDAAAWGAESLAQLEQRLRRASPERRVRVMAGIDMQLDEFLVTRLVEAAIHLDDLASSVKLETPLSPAATRVVVDCLVTVARHRHGDLEVMRAMSRPDRASAYVVRVF